MFNNNRPVIDNIKLQYEETKRKLQRSMKPKNEYEDQDMVLWKRYKYQGDQAAKWELLKRFEGMIAEYARKQSNVRSVSVVEAELKRIALESFDKYDPNAGAKMNTYLMSNFRKVSRANIQNQQAIRLPENVALKYGKFNEAQVFLTDAYGRPPTDIEMSEHLGWGVDDVEDARRRFHKELVESRQVFDPGVMDADISKSALYSAYYSMSPQEQFILEHSTGFNGKPEMKDRDIQEHLKLTGYQYNKLKNSVIDKVQQSILIHQREE